MSSKNAQSESCLRVIFCYIHLWFLDNIFVEATCTYTSCQRLSRVYRRGPAGDYTSSQRGHRPVGWVRSAGHFQQLSRFFLIHGHRQHKQASRDYQVNIRRLRSVLFVWLKLKDVHEDGRFLFVSFWEGQIFFLVSDVHVYKFNCDDLLFWSLQLNSLDACFFLEPNEGRCKQNKQSFFAKPQAVYAFLYFLWWFGLAHCGRIFVYHLGSNLSLCLCVYGWLADLDPAAAIPRVAAPA